ncbi:glycosyltransferase family 4 protein [Akkermansiaceae bacterium]|nr:glycosyltransferase family 4 protein [Akkermansiaceae bacterium]
MGSEFSQWVVCQIGAREHYGVARALHQAGQLAGVITDFWVPPGSPTGRLPGCQRLADRFHPDLVEVSVKAPNARMLAFALGQRVRSNSGWTAVLERNALFQKKALALLPSLIPASQTSVTLFSYSYAALDLFREAKKRGWTTVLGQIDPGPEEDALVKRLRAEHPEWAGGNEQSPPEKYWQDWREECALADRILVNSEWSRSLMADAGIERSKIEVLPLAVEGPMGADVTEKFKIQNSKFTIENPLRVLFLGQAIVRKGIQDLAIAARALTDLPIQIDVVGPHGVLPDGLPSNLIFHGPVPRSEAAKWYDLADVFVLPTHSDGFALTQIEAMAHGLPVIATTACGDVVVDGVNGTLVPPGKPEALAASIRWMLDHPEQREAMGIAAKKTLSRFGLEQVANTLISCKPIDIGL